MRIRRALVLAAVFLMVAPLPVARACSCGGENPRDALARTDAAVIGVVLSRADVGGVGRNPDQTDWRVRVEKSFKGKLSGEVVVRSDGPDEHTCGLRVEIGDRVGLFIHGIEGRLYTCNCEKVTPEVMKRASEPLPSAAGQGPPVFLAKTTGKHDLVSLDARGRVLSYGDTKYHPEFDVCPGGAWAAEIDTGWEKKGTRSYLAVGRRDLRTMKLRGVDRLERFETSWPEKPEFYINEVWCRDPESREVYALGRPPEHIGPSSGAVLLRLRDDRADIVTEEPLGSVAFAATRSAVYLATGDRRSGFALEELDLVANERRRLVEMRGPVLGVVVDSTGTMLAGAEYSVGGPKAALFTYNLETKEIYRSTHPRTFPVWVGDRIAAPHHTGQGLHVYDDRTRRIASKPGWKGGAVAVGDRIYGAWSGVMWSTNAGPGPIQAVSEVGLTLEPIDAARVVSTLRRPRFTWAALGVLLFLLAIGMIVLRSRRGRRSEPSEGSSACV